MKRYKFLFKPFFFICCLLFATWLTLRIEKIQPSDFGKHKSIFDPAPRPRIVYPQEKEALRAMALEFKYGIIDSVTLERKLEKFLEPPKTETLEEQMAGDKAKETAHK
jgi:hypothetical protein